jgi:hypothetical protein
MRALRPTTTPSERIESSARAWLCTRTPGETMRRYTWPPEMIAPWQTIELYAAPRRWPSVCTNFGGG